MAIPPDFPQNRVQAATVGPRQHFFGYYEKTPWSANGRSLLTLESEVADRPLVHGDTATVGLIDLEGNNAFHPLAQTHAWNWQQGCMLQWLPTDPDNSIVYNDRVDDAFVSVVLDIHTGARRTLPHAIYSLSHDGRVALALNFTRLARCRPVTGYAAISSATSPLEPYPDDDGIYLMDMETSVSRLLLSFAQIAAFDPSPHRSTTPHWFEHLVWNPDDSRFLFLHRCQLPGSRHLMTRLFTANCHGLDIQCVSDHEMVSHFDWKNSHQILAWARRYGIGDRYFLFTDGTGEVEVIGEGVLTRDGHCSFSPDRRWVLTDTYPDEERLSSLFLYRWEDERLFDLGRFYAPPHLTGDIRCDLHPRWNRRGDQVCIDSAHEGTRQVYVLDVAALVPSH